MASPNSVDQNQYVAGADQVKKRKRTLFDPLVYAPRLHEFRVEQAQKVNGRLASGGGVAAPQARI